MSIVSPIKEKILVIIAGISITLICSIILLSKPVFLKLFDGHIYDIFLISFHHTQKSSIPIIIDIDEKSLKRYGQWPWPRYRVALLLERLKSLGITAVGLDIVFSESDRTSPVQIKKALLSDLNLKIDFVNIPKELLDNDKLLATTLSNGPYILGYKFISEKDRLSKNCIINPINISFIDESLNAENVTSLYEANDVLCNLPILSKAAKFSGFYNNANDRDGTFRTIPLLMKFKGKYYPNLALATYLYALGTNQLIVKRDGFGIKLIKAGDVIIPVDPQSLMLIHFRGPRQTFPYISASDVLDGLVLRDKLEGKIAFIGSSAAGLLDIRLTPLDRYYPGVEVYATIVDTFINKDFLSIPSWGIIAELFVTLLSGIISTIIFARSKAFRCLVSYILMILVILFFIQKMMVLKGYWLSPTIPIILLSINFTVIVLLKFYSEESAKRFLHSAFSKYVSSEIIEKLVKNPKQLSLQGEEKEITILFSDIRNFTTMSETMSPINISLLLKEYFTPMTKIIKKNYGTIDKFIGDAIMAFYNAPLDIKDHQAYSIKSALLMLNELNLLNIDLNEQFGKTLDIGIGLHSGVAMVGNMGSEDLFNYSVIGDNVNLASRIEGLTKKYGLKLILSDAIVNGCKNSLEHFNFVQIDKVRVKGKITPIILYTVYTEDQYKKLENEIPIFHEAMKLYYDGSFLKAEKMFNILAKEYNQTVLYDLYLNRCASLQLNPPKETWDGIFTYEEK